MIHEFRKPIKVVTPLGDGFGIYVTANGMMENDEWAVCMVDDGQVRHFLTSDIKVWYNGTYGIGKKSQSHKK